MRLCILWGTDIHKEKAEASSQQPQGASRQPQQPTTPPRLHAPLPREGWGWASREPEPAVRALKLILVRLDTPILIILKT
jgi:hypothetical protein